MQQRKTEDKSHDPADEQAKQAQRAENAQKCLAPPPRLHPASDHTPERPRRKIIEPRRPNRPRHAARKHHRLERIPQGQQDKDYTEERECETNAACGLRCYQSPATPSQFYPPAMAATIQNASFPEATASGSGVSGESCERSSSQAKNRSIG